MTPIEWLRRQRRAQAEAVLDAYVATALTVAPAPEATPMSEPDVDAELAALREEVSKLRAQVAIETVRAVDAERALSNQNTLLDHKDQVIARLRPACAPADERRFVPAPAWWDGAEKEPRAGTEAAHWYRIAHGLQERNLQLQKANEAHDRAPAGRRR